MIYLLKHKAPRKNSYKKIALLAGVVAALALIFHFWSGLLAPSLFRIMIPASSFFKRAGQNLELGFRLFEPKGALLTQNEKLQKRIGQLEALMFDYEIIRKENASLRQNLGFTSPELILTSVLLAPPKTPYDSILIDRGEADGVYAGAKVLTSERTLLGFVEEVYGHASRVRMYSSAGIQTSAVLERDGTLMELLGAGGGNFVLEAPLGFNIVEGDVFFIPGSERLALAVVGQVKRQETSSFTKVWLRIPFKMSGSTSLFVSIK